MPTADACAANEAVVRRIFDAFARKEGFAFRDLFAADAVWTVPGDGAVDFPSVLAALKAHGYGGWLVVEAEQDPAKAHPLTYARIGHDYLRPLVQSLAL